MLDALKRVNGAGQAQIMGVPNQAMRIWMNPDRMASLGITTSDIANAINQQNQLFGAGQIGQQPNAGPVELTFPVITQPQFTEPKQYENIILRAAQDGSAIVRVGDVARAEIGLQQYIVDSNLNGVPATIIAVYQQPGANGLVVSKAVRKTMEDMKSRFPDGMEYTDLARHQRLRAAVDQGGDQDAVRGDRARRAGRLPVPAELPHDHHLQRGDLRRADHHVRGHAGARASRSTSSRCSGWCSPSAWWSTTRSSWCENVERNMHQHHLEPKEATIRSMDEIASSLVAVVLVMCSVFIPAAFLPGTTGQLYKQFAITIVISVSVSGFIALTLTPAMCAVMLKHSPPPQRGFFAWFNRQVDHVTQLFGDAVTFTSSSAMVVALVLLAGFLYAIWHLFQIIPTSFVPNEDQGYAMAAIIMPQAASLSRTQEIAEQGGRRSSRACPASQTRTVVTGYSLLDSGFKTNAGTIFVTFADFDERYKDIDTAKQQNARAILAGLLREGASRSRARS